MGELRQALAPLKPEGEVNAEGGVVQGVSGDGVRRDSLLPVQPLAEKMGLPPLDIVYTYII